MVNNIVFQLMSQWKEMRTASKSSLLFYYFQYSWWISVGGASKTSFVLTVMFEEEGEVWVEEEGQW